MMPRSQYVFWLENVETQLLIYLVQLDDDEEAHLIVGKLIEVARQLAFLRGME